MNQYLHSDNRTPKDRLVKWLHIFMIALCILATFALYNNPTTGVKLIISLLLVIYTLTVIFNSRTVKLIFKIGHNEAQQSYRQVHSWSIQADTTSKQIKEKSKSNQTIDNIHFGWKKNENQSINNVSFDKSLDRSQDIKNMSMSIYRSLNTSGLSDSRLSRNRSSLKKRELKGFDLSEAFIFKSSKDLQASSLKSLQSGIVLVDSHTYLSNNTQHFQEEAEKEYEKVLKVILKKDRRYMGAKYESILNYLRNLAKQLMNQHNFAADKLKELGKQFFDVVLVENCKNADYQTGLKLKKGTLQHRMAFNVFIYKLLLLKEDKVPFADVGLPLKMGKRWTSAQSRFQQYIRAMIKLSQSFGVDSSIIKSRFKDSTKKFVEDYFNSIEMLQSYLKVDAKQMLQGSDVINGSSLCYLSKCRTYLLYLFVRQVNLNLKYAGKIKLNDNLNLRYPNYDKIELEIVKRAGSQDPLLHFDVYKVEEGKDKDRICCEPGQRNYLSVIYFLLYNLNTKADLLSWNAYIKRLVSEMI